MLDKQKQSGIHNKMGKVQDRKSKMQVIDYGKRRKNITCSRFSEEQEVEGSEGYVKKKWVGHGNGHVDGSPGKRAEVGGDGDAVGRGGVDGEERASNGHIGSN